MTLIKVPYHARSFASGNAITEDYDLVWPYLLNVGGRRTVRDFDEKAQIQEGSYLSLLEEPC